MCQCQEIDNSVLVILFVGPMKNLGGGHVVAYISLELLRILLVTVKPKQTNKQDTQLYSLTDYFNHNIHIGYITALDSGRDTVF